VGNGKAQRVKDGFSHVYTLHLYQVLYTSKLTVNSRNACMLLPDLSKHCQARLGTFAHMAEPAAASKASPAAPAAAVP
jgi:hypothetical protein